ncbi:MAG: PspA/IM30 family protein [Granulosicoccus sp.]
MALITRMSRLFKADFHAVLDQIEEPGALLRQSIREMEEILEDAQLRQAHTVHREQKLFTRLNELDHSLLELDEKLDLCFESGQDELARGLVKRKLESSALRNIIDVQHRAIAQDALRQKKALAENQQVLESLRQKADVFAEPTVPESDLTRAGHDQVGGIFSPPIDDNDIEVAWLQEKARRRSS